MGEIAVTLNRRTYRLACDDGEEARLAQLADYVRLRLEKLTQQFGRVGEDRLLLMTALLIADELIELRESLGETVPEPGADATATGTRRRGKAAGSAGAD